MPVNFDTMPTYERDKRAARSNDPIILRKLSKYRHTWRCLADNKYTPPDTLKKIYEDTTASDILLLLAGNPATPKSILREISTDYGADLQLLERLARNPSTSPDTLEGIANHSSTRIRYYIIENPNTPPELRHQLAMSFPESWTDIILKIDTLAAHTRVALLLTTQSM